MSVLSVQDKQRLAEWMARAKGDPIASGLDESEKYFVVVVPAGGSTDAIVELYEYKTLCDIFVESDNEDEFHQIFAERCVDPEFYAVVEWIDM